MTLFPLIYYQGLCHKCQNDFYYPGDDRFAKPKDERELKCVVCNYPERKNMILNNVEKDCIVKSLFWMVEDLKHRHDELKGNLEEGSQGDYSPELKAAVDLLKNIKKVETTETTGNHRKSTLLNCREFACISNRQGICATSKITLESVGSLNVGYLKCVESERQKTGEEN